MVLEFMKRTAGLGGSGPSTVLPQVHQDRFHAMNYAEGETEAMKRSSRICVTSAVRPGVTHLHPAGPEKNAGFNVCRR